MTDLVATFPNLTHLSMLKNPCVPNPYVDENRERYQEYRYFILSRLRNLTTLDTEPVTSDERLYVASRRVEEISLPSPEPQQVMSLVDVRACII